MGAKGKGSKEKEFTPLELELMEKMTPKHKALMGKLNARERESMAQNVKPEYIDMIQSWIGTDEEIEEMLFWDKGGKFDDPEWQGLKPLDEITDKLFQAAKTRFEELKKEAVEIQRRSDLTLFSQFNAALLFTGLAGAIRCDAEGGENRKGKFFRGVELRCIGSVQRYINSITILPSGSRKLEVHFGSRFMDKAQGVLVYTDDSFSLIQLARLVDKELPKLGYETTLEDLSGQIISLDAKSIRKASRKGDKLGYGKELTLYASARIQGIGEAIQAAEELCRCFYERFGLETECSKIGKEYKNFFIMRDDNFDQLLPPSPVESVGLVLFTATLVCRRCRREIEGFRDLAKSYPDLTFALVNLTSPQSKFYNRVFGDMGGGDPKRFRDGAKGATPFTIIYVSDENRVLRFAEYYGTGKAEAPPSLKECEALLDKYFS